MTRIMIVEDELLIADGIKEDLKSIGYETSCIVTSGEDAVHAAGQNPPDLILMDIYLSGDMDGIEAAEKIYAAQSTPIIFLTAYSDDAILKKAKKVGAYGYLIKPVECLELKATIEMVLQRNLLDEKRLMGQKKELMDQKQKSLQTFAGGVSHHLNNILTSVLGNLEIALGSDAQFNDNLIRLIKNAQENALRASDLCRQILTYVGNYSGDRDTVDLDRILYHSTEAFAQSSTQNVQFTYTPSPGPVLIKSRDNLIRQVLSNLVKNSIEALDGREGTIELSAGKVLCTTSFFSGHPHAQAMPPGTYAFLRVADNAAGMESSTIEQAFDPFFTTKFVGRGLGLSISLGIVQSHKGTIIIEKSDDMGTVVKAFFPTASSPAFNGGQQIDIEDSPAS